MGRLVAVQRSGNTTTYCYDLAGNIETIKLGPGCANNPPVAVGDSTSINGLVAKMVNVTNNDSDVNNDAIFVSQIVSQPPHASVSVHNSSSVRITPSSYGTHSFQYRISDGEGGQDTAAVSVTVNNRRPSASNDTGSMQDRVYASTFNVIANDSDPDGDPLRVQSCVRISGPSSTCTVVSNTSVRLNTTNAGTHTYRITIFDEAGSFDLSDTSTLTVNKIEEPGGGGGNPIF